MFVLICIVIKEEKTMTKRKNVILTAIIIVSVLLCSLIAFGTVMAVKDYNKEIPLTDLTQTYKGEVTDSAGNLLVPFDVAYPETFASGEVEYDETALLIKMNKSYKGKLTNNLKKCGFVSIEKFAEVQDGNWYRATISEDTDVLTAIQKSRSLTEVLVADYNYIYQSEDAEIVEGNETESEEGEIDKKPGEDKPTPPTPGHNPGFEIIDEVKDNKKWNEQDYLTEHNIQDAWQFLKDNGISAGGSSSVVVAVIDTGVDYTHPDLKTNIWVNMGEIPNNGKDDDGNGYVDDVYGWDFVQNDNTPKDEHSHGTHVAGIIAASNNKEGVVGIAYNVKIMPVRAGDKKGKFDNEDVAKAIIYAYENGADVINMSFGNKAISAAVQDALLVASSRSTLVASAGNDGKANEGKPSSPNYPAAYSYVIGVMSVNKSGIESGFTNYDVNKYNEVEYETYAIGEGILSTLPGGKYGKLTGTSMATPIVSATAALLRSYYSDRDLYPAEFISAQICSTSEEKATCVDPKKHGNHNIPAILDLKQAFTKLPKPNVNLSGYEALDSESISENNNGNGIFEAGETIDLGVALRNLWGTASELVVTLDTYSEEGILDPYIEIITDTTGFESVGTYSTIDNYIYTGTAITGFENPLTVKIKASCPNNYTASINATITYKNGLDANDPTTYVSKGKIEFNVRSGEILPSRITEDLTLTNDNYYIVINSTYIAEGVTVTVEPGTNIQFWTNDKEDPYFSEYMAKLNVDGSFIVEGTAEDPVLIYPSEARKNYRAEISGRGIVHLKYANVTNPHITGAATVSNCNFNQNNGYQYYRYLSNGYVVDGNSYANVVANTISHSNFTGLYYPTVKANSTVSNAYFDNCSSLKITASEMSYANIYNSYNLNLSVPYISNSVISKCSSATIDGSLDTCAIVETSFGIKSNYAYNNCVFYNTSKIGPSFGTLLTDITVDNIYRDTKTGVSTIYFNVEGNSNTLSKYHFESLAKELGGEVYSSGAIKIPGSIYCDSIRLDKETVTIDLESQYAIKGTVLPSTFDVSQLIYVSEDENIATVTSNGIIQPKKQGETRVFVYSPDYKIYDVIDVKIEQKVPVTGITIKQKDVLLNRGASTVINPTLSPSNTTELKVTYKSSDTSVATVDEVGRVTGVAPGEAIITATAQNGATAQIKIRVEIFIESITINNKKENYYYPGEKLQLDVTVYPADATEKLVFESGDIASVDENGLVTFLQYRKNWWYDCDVYIYVGTESGSISRAYTRQYIKEPVQTFRFEENSYYTYVGDISESWKPYVKAYDKNYKIEYTSSNPDVAYVDENGKLVRVSDGVALIIATAKGSGISPQQLCVYVGNDNKPYEYDVIDYAYDQEYGYFAFVTNDNLLWLEKDGKVPEIMLENVVDVFSDGGAFYAITVEGEIAQIDLYDLQISYDSYLEYQIGNLKIVSADAHNGSIYLVSEDGELYVTGNNNCGQLGIEGQLNVSWIERVYNFSDVYEVIAFENSAIVVIGEYYEEYGYGYFDFYLMGTGLNHSSPKHLFSTYSYIGSNEYAVKKYGDCVYVSGNDISDYCINGSTGIISNDSYPYYIYDGYGVSVGDYYIENVTDIFPVDIVNEKYYVVTTEGMYCHYKKDYYNDFSLDFTAINPTISKDLSNIEIQVKECTVSDNKVTFVLENTPSDYFSMYHIHRNGGGAGYGSISYTSLGNNVYEVTLSSAVGTHQLFIDYRYPWNAVTRRYKLVEIVVEEDKTTDQETPVKPDVPATPTEPQNAPLKLTYTSIGARKDNVALMPEFLVFTNKDFSYDASLISLVNSNGNSVSLKVTKTGNVLAITPTENLVPNTRYTISVQAGAIFDEENATIEAISAEFVTIKQYENFYWTKANVQPFIDKWLDEGKNSYISNSAILNEYSEEKATAYIRFVAPNGTGVAYGLGGNYWGTTNIDIIDKTIVDFDDYEQLCDIVIGQILTSAPEEAYPFVINAYVVNSNGEKLDVVSNETVTIVVEFNRDMDVSIPLYVTFGTDNVAEGSYVNARRWEGTCTLAATAENGTYGINISNARAADDIYLTLCEPTTARFSAVVDTTEAQAMLMQAEATKTGINLTWMQDDFDTLAGYNVYRSDKEDGNYIRLNEYVIPVGECEFFDDTVEPGKLYYYNFTVVKTDLTESTPSGKISIMSLDTMAPNVYHTPVRTGYTGSNLIINATVTDNLGVKSVMLYFRTIGASEWKSTVMTPHNSRYSGIINADYLTLDGIEYYIESYDGVNYTYNGSSTNPYSVLIKLAVDANSLGDVDGDGIITNKDALMLLQAANDLLNLTEDQFMRADINGDKELSASEALRILQYVSGKVTTIVGE